MVMDKINCKFVLFFAEIVLVSYVVLCLSLKYALKEGGILQRQMAVRSRRSSNETLDPNVLEPKLQIYREKQPDHDGYLMANLTTRQGKTPICLFHVEYDIYISANILKNGRWEARTFTAMETLFESNHSWNFLDIGSHVGNFALMAAKWGRKVVAVDSSFDCITRLRRSCDLGGFSNEQVVTVWNAIGDEYKTVTTSIWPKNMAAGYIMDMVNVTSADSHQAFVPMVRLDDLLQIVNFRKAIMKLDIEGYEAKALKHAEKLFMKMDLPYVFMKWHILRRNEASAKTVLKFFLGRGYVASKIGTFQALPISLRPGYYLDWPETFCWVHISHQYQMSRGN